jgi:hypothetical protein
VVKKQRFDEDRISGAIKLGQNFEFSDEGFATM